MNFCSDPRIFQVLGIKFSADTVQISLLNFEGKICEIRKILNNWSRRQITALGEIIVVKTLVLPKLIRRFVNLPNPAGDLKKKKKEEEEEERKIHFCGMENGVRFVKMLSVNCKEMEH